MILFESLTVIRLYMYVYVCIRPIYQITLFLVWCSFTQLLVASLFFLYHRNVTVVLTDSRGASLRRMIGDPNVIIEAVRGARLQEMVGRAAALIPRLNPKSCLVIAGINNMTIMNRRTRKVSLLYYDPFELANHVIRLINRVRRHLIDSFPRTKFGFGGVIGIDINHYNDLEGYSPYQWIIDEAIRQINSYIRLLNQQLGLYHPRLTSKVHSYYRGKPKNHYRLLRDGLHLGDTMINSWARNIERYHLVNTVGIIPFWNGHYGNNGNPLDGQQS